MIPARVFTDILWQVMARTWGPWFGGGFVGRVCGVHGRFPEYHDTARVFTDVHRGVTTD